MRGFRLLEPDTIAEAVDQLEAHGTRARPLAGGTDLVAGVMRDQISGKGMPLPTHLVDLTRIPGLAGIEVGPDGATIQAATTLVDIAESAELAATWPLLTGAAAEVASPEIRAIGTLGGNVNQRPRCWFFRSKDFDCAKKGGDICYAVKGDNRYNAILEGNLCFIVHPSDLATALLALDAEAHIASPTGSRTVPFDDYFIGPDVDLLRENVLGPDELLTGVRIPVPAPGSVQAWRKINEKGLPTWDFAVVSVAVSATIVDGRWQDGRIVIGGVAPVPYRALAVEQALAGNEIRTNVTEAVGRIGRLARPMGHNGYKVQLVEHLLTSVILDLLDGTPASPPAAGTGRVA